MKRVIIESPYAGEVALNLRYAHECARKCIIDRNEAAWGSHMVWPQFLAEDLGEERALGIAAGLVWGEAAELHAFYTDRGWSQGMKDALHNCLILGRKFEIRHIYPDGLCLPYLEGISIACWVTILAAVKKGPHYAKND